MKQAIAEAFFFFSGFDVSLTHSQHSLSTFLDCVGIEESV
jgi:hypothetical protein